MLVTCCNKVYHAHIKMFYIVNLEYIVLLDKQSIVKDFKIHDKDTGSSAVQIGILTAKIKILTEHLKSNHKDEHSRHGLLNMVSSRRKLLSYMHRVDLVGYKALIEKLGIRK